MRVIFQCASLNVAAHTSDCELVGVPQHDIVVVTQSEMVKQGETTPYVP